MERKTPAWILWSVAIVIMAGTAIYQRRTGPTYPVKGTIAIEGNIVRFTLPRSYDGKDDAVLRIAVPSTEITGFMDFRRFRSYDEWIRQALVRDSDFLAGRIPHQPIAGKVMYRIVLQKGSQEVVPLTSDPIVIRFRGKVPLSVVIPHVTLMFLALLFAGRAGLEDLAGGAKTYRYACYAVISLLVGGLILGPLMQKYAFDALWTGWPLGKDLTDNKTLIALIVWLVTFIRLRKNRQARGWAAIALLLMLAVYFIPHSVLGSELDYTKLK